MRAPVNSFEFQPCDRTPQVDALNAFASATDDVFANPASSASSFTAWTTGYLILFAPHAFVPECQIWASVLAFAFGIPPAYLRILPLLAGIPAHLSIISRLTVQLSINQQLKL